MDGEYEIPSRNEFNCWDSSYFLHTFSSSRKNQVKRGTVVGIEVHVIRCWKLERLLCLRLSFLICTLVLLRMFFLLFVCSYYFLNDSSTANKYVVWSCSLIRFFFHARVRAVGSRFFLHFTVGLK